MNSSECQYACYTLENQVPMATSFMSWGKSIFYNTKQPKHGLTLLYPEGNS